MLLSVLAGCAILTWAATTLDALLTLSVVSLVAAGLVIREVRGPIDFNADVRVATVGFASLLCGTGLLLALTGTTDLAGIESTLAANYQPDRSDLLTGRGSISGVAALVCVLGGVAFPIGLFPFQYWQTRLFAESPGWLAVSISVLLRLQGLGVLIRVFDVAGTGYEDSAQIVTALPAAASCLAGTSLLCRAESLRAIAGSLWLTWGGLSVAGYAISVTHPVGQTIDTVMPVPAGAVVALVVAVIGVLVCGTVMALEAHLARGQRRPEFFAELTGLGRQAPATSCLLLAALLSCIPIPPLPMFWCLILLVAGAFIPGVQADGVQQEAAGAIPLLTLGAVGVSLFLIAARLTHPLSLLFFHEPLRRFETSAGRTSFLIASLAVLALLLAGLLPLTFYSAAASFVALTSP
jgi:NADH:ubiquinone oxidoreductase subunit 2 (subunit N)